MRRIAAFFIPLALLAGCTAPQETDDGTGQGDSGEFTTGCGVVINGEIYQSVSIEDAIPVRIGAGASNQVIVELPDGGLQLVKLSGVADVGSSQQPAVQELFNRYRNDYAYFYPAGDSCDVVVAGGGNAVVGQLISGGGESFSEMIVQRGLAASTADEPCGSAEYAQCLSALGDSNPVTAGPLTSFLWKPVSDSNGKLAIHTGPYDTTVIVNGEAGENAGPGNGYGSLARFSKPGCGYPSPQIQVIDNYSGLRYEVGGATTFTVGNPCGRHCLVGESIEACSK